MTESEIANLKAFARELLRQMWDNGVDSSDIEALAIEHCLIVEDCYDPAKHGEQEDYELGDTLYVLSDWMKG
jgi:hypothetical protein